MQPLAAWLVARPQNGVIGLAATLLVPFINVFSGIFMALLVLKNGARVAVLQAGIAAALLAVVSLVTGTTTVQVAIFALVVWGPAVIVAAILAKTRSLTLTLQVMALAIIAIAVVIFGFVDDVVAFAEPLTTFFLEVYRSGGLGAQADALASRPVEFAEELLRVALWVNWILWVLYLLFGYRFYRHATESGPVYGKFHDLDFGYVLAIGMAIALVVSYLAGIAWLQQVGIVMLAVFVLQGLSVLHFAVDIRALPMFVLILAYLLLITPVLNSFVIIALAAFGYSDAWVRFRPRILAAKQDKDL